MSVNNGAFHFSIKHDILGRRFASVSWVEHEYRMGTWPGGKGRGERFGGHRGERAGWVMARVGNDRGELDRGGEAGGESPVGKRRGEDAGGGGA